MEVDLSLEAGARIRNARQKRGLSQNDLAEATDLSINVIRNIETKTFTSKVGTLRRVCEYLELDPNYVLYLEPRTYVDDYEMLHRATKQYLGPEE